MRSALCFLACATVVCAQENINNASVSGRVTDPSGSVVEGAQVTARETETDVPRSTRTDKEGRFRFPYLGVGRYQITVRQQGFTETARAVNLSVGAAFDLAFVLTVGASETGVTVSGEQALIETARSQISGTILPTEVKDLPLNGRNFLDLALLVPGVSPTNTASTQFFAETSAVPGQGISIGSQRNFSNSFIVDGLSANDDAAGLTGTFYGLDVVREFQVVTSGGQAEFGRALGGYINMVTRSGTNTLHGDAYGYLRNQRLNAANALTNVALPLTQGQYGASLSGPVVRGRTFYFANFERRDLNQDGMVTISPSNAGAINAQLAAVGYPGSLLSTGLFSNPVHSSNFLVKVDHRFSDYDQFSARYSLYDVDSRNSRGAGALSAVTAAAGLRDRDQTIAINNIATLSPRTVNETRAQFTHSNLGAPPNDPVGPAVSISGVASFGTLSGSPVARLDKLYEIADNVSHQSGPHALRAGVDVLYNDLAITFPQSIRGSYSFSSLPNFTKGAYNNSGFAQSFGNPVVAQTNPNLGFYAQDEWKLSPGFTLNAGIRYDLEFLKTIATDTNNISPRAGFAWSPGQARGTVVRGSYGLFYDRVPLRPLANALLSSGNTTELTSTTFTTVSLSPGQAGAPVFPNILPALPPGVLLNFSTMDRHMQNAYSEQGSLEIERQIGRAATLSVSYQHVRGLHLLLSVNENTPTCVAAGMNNGCRPNPAFGNNKQYSSLADSHYDGLQVSFVQRPGRWGNYRVSYTYSKALDNVSEFFFSSPIDNFNIWKDYGRSDDDQRSRLMFDGTIHAPLKIDISTILQYYSPLPFNIVTGSNTVQGTAARPLLADGSFVGRNTGVGFDFFTVNARISRTFPLGERIRVQTMAEGFNVLNHRNDLIPNGTFGSGTTPLGTFGKPTAVGDPRSFQLALRVSF